MLQHNALPDSILWATCFMHHWFITVFTAPNITQSKQILKLFCEKSLPQIFIGKRLLKMKLVKSIS